MTVTASIGSSQGGDRPYQWSLEYDDVVQRVSAAATAHVDILAITVVVQITKAGGTRKVQFLQPGHAADGDTDFSVVMPAAGVLIGPTIGPAQVARIVGKIGTVTGGLPFDESSTRA